MNNANPHRLKKPLLGGAALLLALGIGNLTYGNYKAHEYSVLLARAQEVTPPAHGAISGLTEDTGPSDAKSRYRAKLQARIEFYELVVAGGWCILALSGLTLVFALGVLRGGPPPEDSKMPRS